jgi:peroxiredoxin
LKGQPPLIRTVKIGEGFQGQNSRWLHFGLGRGPVIEEIHVTWPGGTVETFTGCAANGRFILRQGKGAAEPARPSVGADPQRTRMPRPVPENAENSPVLLTASQICPPFPAKAYDGKAVSFTDSDGPTLIHLWDVSCADCLPELKALAAAREQIAAAGLRVCLISAGADEETTAFLKENAIPFPAAAATDETVRRLRHLHELLFGSDLPLPNPSGLLLDGQGHAAALYRGPVPVQRLLADVRGLSVRWPQRAALTLPFPGQWMDPPVPANPLTVPGELAEKGFLDDSLAVFLRHEKKCATRQGCSEVLMALAAAFEKKNRFADAITTYRLAVRIAPEFPPAMNNLAWHLAVCPDPVHRRPADALPVIEKAIILTNRQNPDLLDTLATVHAANKQWPEAEAALLEAIGIARSAGATQVVQQLEANLQRIRQRK